MLICCLNLLVLPKQVNYSLFDDFGKKNSNFVAKGSL